jgi:hypothetical protein
MADTSENRYFERKWGMGYRGEWKGRVGEEVEGERGRRWEGRRRGGVMKKRDRGGKKRGRRGSKGGRK